MGGSRMMRLIGMRSSILFTPKAWKWRGPEKYDGEAVPWHTRRLSLIIAFPYPCAKRRPCEIKSCRMPIHRSECAARDPATKGRIYHAFPATATLERWRDH